MNKIDSITREGAVERPKTVHFLPKVLLFSIFLLLSGALQRPIGGDVIEGTISGGYTRGQNIPIILLGVGIYGASALALLFGKKGIRLRTAMFWILSLNLLAILSAAWSYSPSQTIIRSMGLTGATICALFAYSNFTAVQFIKYITQFSVFFIVSQAIVAIIMPSYAYHSSYEFYSYAAGLLKGTYIHKNDMAKSLSLFLIILFSFGGASLKNKYIYWGSLALGFFLLTRTGSAKTFASVPAALVAGYILSRIRIPRRRLAFLIYIVGGWAIADVSGILDYIFSLAVTSLDRDPTLSGRTIIWETAIQFAVDHGYSLMGGGYQTAWGSGIGEAVRSMTGSDPGHPHNGFINTFLELGVIGMALLMAHLLSIIKKLSLFRGNPHNIQFFLWSWIALLITNNLGGTYMMLPGDIYWFLLVLTPIMLTWPEQGENSAQPLSS